MKTGHTDAGGYGLTGTAVRDGRRVIIVLNGMTSMRQRDEESARLIEWAFREWGSYTLFKAGDVVDKADVWLGTKQTVQLVAAKDIEMTIPRRARPQLKVAAIYDSPIAAPVAMGQEIGKLVVTAPGAPTIEMPLVADASSDRLGFTGRVSAGLSYLLWGSGKK